MGQPDHKFWLIGNRLSAIIAVGVTGFLAAEEFRAIFSDPPRKFSWLFPLDSLPLPTWTAVALNVFFYLYMLWLGFWGCRKTQGKERIVVAGFCTGGLFGLAGPIRALASPRAVMAIQSIQAAGMSVAFVAALLILLRSPALE